MFGRVDTSDARNLAEFVHDVADGLVTVALGRQFDDPWRTPPSIEFRAWSNKAFHVSTFRYSGVPPRENWLFDSDYEATKKASPTFMDFPFE